MYSVTIRDHIMVAHSLKDKIFGPAQNMHGATFIADVTFSSAELTKEKIVIDIGFAKTILEDVLQPLRYSNLDEIFPNEITTTEFMAKYIHDKVSEKVASFFIGKITVVLGESHVAWAKYEDDK